MERICSSLAAAGYRVTLIGRKGCHAPPLALRSYRQIRLRCFAPASPLFYIEFNLRLFFALLLRKADCIVAIDLDTILPCLFVSMLKKSKRVYDAHELFCEMKEVVTRPSRYRFWKAIERFAVPRFQHGYTVNEPIAAEFAKMYGSQYAVIRNLPFQRQRKGTSGKKEYILYQGAVNEGRSFETLIPAMQYVKLPLWICGDGNYMEQCKALVQQYRLSEKVLFKGKVTPEALWDITQEACVGITLFENKGKSNYLSLANRFFDYIQAGVPQLCVNYPAYRSILEKYQVALAIEDLSPIAIADALNLLTCDDVLYARLADQCKQAALEFNWTEEEKKLIAFYHALL
ncbi:MAG: glycosyltransferase family 4 protein [Bacteroidetes bacterium]|nr:glycosyltransferase family 4 protein [Bacteroidota bacterium]